jgi:hypothetical protein
MRYAAIRCQVWYCATFREYARDIDGSSSAFVSRKSSSIEGVTGVPLEEIKRADDWKTNGVLLVEDAAREL